MKIKIPEIEIVDKFKWQRVFKILPVKTDDGYIITLGYVWKKWYTMASSWAYHTNPERKEEEYQAINLGYQPLTEGSTLTKNLRGESVIIPKRPPPPQPPKKP